MSALLEPFNPEVDYFALLADAPDYVHVALAEVDLLASAPHSSATPEAASAQGGRAPETEDRIDDHTEPPDGSAVVGLDYLLADPAPASIDKDQVELVVNPDRPAGTEPLTMSGMIQIERESAPAHADYAALKEPAEEDDDA